MASTATVGILRVLLSANTAEYEAAMKKAASSADAWSKNLRSIGQQATNVGMTLTKALTVPLLGIGVGAAKAAIDFESSFANVAKTVDGVSDKFGKLTPVGQKLAMTFRNMAKEIPATTTELNAIAALGGQMGVPINQLEKFTKNVAALGVAVDGISTEEAATGLAAIGNATGQGTTKIAEMSSALVHLGNNSNATEGDILEFTKRLIGAGHSVGMTVPEVMGLGAAMANVGINAEAGGTAMSTVITKISKAVSTGGSSLNEFAKVAGRSAEEFAAVWKRSPIEAMDLFVKGLGTMKARGVDLNLTMGELGTEGIRVADTLKRLSGASQSVADTTKLANEGYAAANKHLEEAQKKYATTEKQLTLLWNRIKDVGITLGNALLPGIKAAIKGFDSLLPIVDSLAKGFAAMPGGAQLVVVGFLALLAAAGPVLIVFGQLAMSAASVAALFGKKGLATRLLAGDLGTLTGAAGKTGAALGLLGKAAALAGAAFVGWQIGRLIADLTGLDKKIADSITGLNNLTKARQLTAQGKPEEAQADITAKLTELEKKRTDALMRLNFVQAAVVSNQIHTLKNDQTRLAIQDSINLAIKRGADTHITYAAAVKFNEEWVRKGAESQAWWNKQTEGGGVVAAGTAKSVSLLAQLNAQYAADLKKIGASGFKEIQTAHEVYGQSIKDLSEKYHVAESSIERWIDSTRKAATSGNALAKAQRDIAGASVELTEAQKATALANERLTISHEKTAKDLGVAVDAIDAYIKGVKNAQEVDAEWVKIREDFAKGTASVYAHWMAQEKKEADASGAALAKLFTERQKFQERVNTLGMSGLTLQLHQLEVARLAEIAALGERTEQNKAFWDQNKTLINAYYKYERSVALGTADTIEARMRAHGVRTKAELQSMANAARIDYEQMKASGLYTYDELAKAAQRAAELQKAANKGIFDRFLEEADKAARSFESVFSQIAQSTEGTVSRIAQTIAVISKGWNDAAAAVEAYANATTLAEKAAAIGQGVAAIASASDPRGKTDVQTIGGSAAAGAKLGSVAGPYGMAVGAVAGALIGWWRSAHAEWKKVANEISKDLGIDIDNISQELAQHIADMEKTIAGGTKDQRRTWSIALSLPEIIDEQGGLNPQNLQKYEIAAQSLFEVIRRGGEAGAKATQVLSGLIGQFAAQAEKTGGMWDPVFKNLIAQSKALGINIEGVTAAVDAQIGKLAGGLGKAVSGAFAGTDKGLESIVKGLGKAEADALADAFKHAQEEGFKGTLTEYFVQQANLYGTAMEGDSRIKTWFSGDTISKFTALLDGTQGAFDRLSRTALASFNAIVASGRSVFDAISEVGPVIDQLIAQHDKLGLKGGAAFDQLARFRILTEQNKELVASVGGLNDVLTALANLGGLNIETLQDLEAQGLQAFEQLQAAGFTQAEALEQLKPLLKSIIQAHYDLGIPIDENTQKVIDLAKANGMLEDDSMSMVDVLKEGLGALIKGFGFDLPDAFKKTGKAAKDAAQVAKDAIDGIPTGKTVQVNIDWGGDIPDVIDVSERVLRDADGNVIRIAGQTPSDSRRYEQGGVVYAAHGRRIGENFGRLLRFKPKGTDTVPAMLTPGEGVLNVPAMRTLGREAFDTLNAGLNPMARISAESQQLLGRTGTDAGPVTIVNHNDFSGSYIDSEHTANLLTEKVGKRLAEKLHKSADMRDLWRQPIKGIAESGL